mgnify:CR=1 FL=1
MQQLRFQPSGCLVFRPSADTAVGIAEEAEKMFYFFIAVQFLFHFGNSLAQVEAGTVQDAEGLLQFPAYFFRDTCPRKADAVQADAAGGLAVGDDERRNILDDFRQAADHAVAADFDELMDAGNAADDDASSTVTWPARPAQLLMMTWLPTTQL